MRDVATLEQLVVLSKLPSIPGRYDSPIGTPHGLSLSTCTVGNTKSHRQTRYLRQTPSTALQQTEFAVNATSGSGLATAEPD
jgi:hypothetical protein